MQQSELLNEIELHPNVGENAPDCTVINATTNLSCTLSSLWNEGPVVLVFLRHLGCTFCREHIAQLQQDEERFRMAGVKLCLITVAQPKDTLFFCQERDLVRSFVCLSDPYKQAYNAYGLSRGSMAKIFAPNVFARGFQATLHGHFVGMPKGDPFQMPGLFAVDSQGVVLFAHRSKDVSDTPPNSLLFEALQAGIGNDEAS